MVALESLKQFYRTITRYCKLHCTASVLFASLLGSGSAYTVGCGSADGSGGAKGAEESVLKGAVLSEDVGGRTIDINRFLQLFDGDLPAFPIEHIEVSPNGNKVAYSDAGGNVVVLDTVTYLPLFQENLPYAVNDLKWNKEGDKLAWVGPCLVVLNIIQSKYHVIKGQGCILGSMEYRSLSWNDDGRRIVLAGIERRGLGYSSPTIGTIDLVEISSGDTVARWNSHGIGTTGISWIGDNEIVSYGLDGKLKFWSLQENGEGSEARHIDSEKSRSLNWLLCNRGKLRCQNGKVYVLDFEGKVLEVSYLDSEETLEQVIDGKGYLAFNVAESGPIAVGYGERIFFSKDDGRNVKFEGAGIIHDIAILDDGKKWLVGGELGVLLENNGSSDYHVIKGRCGFRLLSYGDNAPVVISEACKKICIGGGGENISCKTLQTKLFEDAKDYYPHNIGIVESRDNKGNWFGRSRNSIVVAFVANGNNVVVLWRNGRLQFWEEGMHALLKDIDFKETVFDAIYDKEHGQMLIALGDGKIVIVDTEDAITEEYLVGKNLEGAKSFDWSEKEGSVLIADVDLYQMKMKTDAEDVKVVENKELIKLAHEEGRSFAGIWHVDDDDNYLVEGVEYGETKPAAFLGIWNYRTRRLENVRYFDGGWSGLSLVEGGRIAYYSIKKEEIVILGLGSFKDLGIVKNAGIGNDNVRKIHLVQVKNGDEWAVVDTEYGSRIAGTVSPVPSH